MKRPAFKFINIKKKKEETNAPFYSYGLLQVPDADQSVL